MSYRVVCISRVTAAGGDAIGHLVAERLGFRFVDDEILELAAAHAGVDPSADRRRGAPQRVGRPRIERLRLGSTLLDEAEYATTIDESDPQRREDLARFYGIEDESPTLYDPVVNTDALDIAAPVAAIAAAARA